MVWNKTLRLFHRKVLCLRRLPIEPLRCRNYGFQWYWDLLRSIGFDGYNGLQKSLWHVIFSITVLPRLQTRCGRTDTDCERYSKRFTQQTDSTFYALYPQQNLYRIASFFTCWLEHFYVLINDFRDGNRWWRCRFNYSWFKQIEQWRAMYCQVFVWKSP